MNSASIIKVTCATGLLMLLPGCFKETPKPEAEPAKEIAAVQTEQAPKGEVIATSMDELKNLTATGNVVVDCSATWCGPCQMLAPIFEKIAQDTANVTFVKVDVDQIKMDDIKGVPTLIFYKDGKEIKRQTGSLNEAALRELIKTTFAL